MTTTPVKPIVHNPSGVPAIEGAFKHIEGKCFDDIVILHKIMLQQVKNEVRIPRDLDSSLYIWRESDGRLTGIQWNNMNLQGKLSLKGLTELISLDCSGNQLTELDLRDNIQLNYLNCSQNRLASLELSDNTALVALSCNDNQLTQLTIDKNVALIDLFCFHNRLTNLDVCSNKDLTWLCCSKNRITSLDVRSCDKEIKVFCDKEVIISR